MTVSSNEDGRSADGEVDEDGILHRPVLTVFTVWSVSFLQKKPMSAPENVASTATENQNFIEKVGKCVKIIVRNL